MARNAVSDELLDAAGIVRAYLSGSSIRELSAMTGRSREAIRALILAAGHTPAPRGAGRQRPSRQAAVPARVAKRIRILYVDKRLSRRQVAQHLGLPESTVRAVLAQLDVHTRTRGKLNREDRTRVAAKDLNRLYVKEQLTMAQVAKRLNTSAAIVAASLHDNAIPVRRPTGAAEPETVCVLDALYADPAVLATLARHKIPPYPAAGQLADRVPTPLRLTESLLRDLYLECGLATTHIEMLTGQPAVKIRRRLADLQIPRRPAGGLSPFRRKLSGLSPRCCQ